MMNFPDAPSVGTQFQSGNLIWQWDGEKWLAASAPGVIPADITAVLAGTGLNGGGTTGDVTLGLVSPVAIANGGTGAVNAPAALTSLGAVARIGDTMTGPLTINQNTAALPARPALAVGQGLWVGGADSQVASLGMDAFGGFPVQYFRAAKGTAAAMTALTSTDLITVLQCHGAQNSTTYGQAAQITCKSRDNWTTAAHGAYWYIETCPPGSVTLETAVTIGRGLVVGGTITNDPGPGGIYATGNSTLTGTLHLQPPTSTANLVLRKATAADSNNIYGNSTGDQPRWVLSLGDSGAESGGNAGTDFGLHRFTDTGAYIGAALQIARATGNATFTGNTTIAPTSGSANLFLNKPASGSHSMITGQRGGLNRWLLSLGDDHAETGGNSGSDFYLYRDIDAGGAPTITLNINRATGDAAFSGWVRSTSFNSAQFYTSNGSFDGGTWRSNIAGWVSTLNFDYASGLIYFYGSTASVAAGGAATMVSRGFLDTGGNLTISGGTATKPGGGSWTAPSDIQLKVRDSIVAYTTGLDAITQLKPVTYKYNGKAGLPKDQTFHGLVADDVETVMPEAVGRAILGQRPAMNDGDVDEPGEEYRTLDQTPLLFALINAVKELKSELDELKAK